MKKRPLQPFIDYLSLIVLAIGVLVLLGWATNMHIFTRVTANLNPTNPATAIALLLAACWLLLSNRQHPSFRWVAAAASVLVLLVPICRTADHIGTLNVRIDQLLFSDKLQGAVISPVVTFCLFFIGLGMLCYSLFGSRGRAVIHVFGFVSLFVALLNLYGYLLNINTVSTSKPFVPMGVLSALCLTLISVCMLVINPGNRFVKYFSGNDLGGVTARKLLPYVIFVPPVLAWLRLKGEVWNYYDSYFGIALQSLAIVFILLAVVWQSARALRQIDTRRQKAEKNTNEYTKELKDLNKNLERSNQELEQYAFVASHDLQEPLRKLMTFTALLTEKSVNLTDLDRQYIEKIYQAAERMRLMIKDLLHLSRVIQYTEAFEPVQLSSVISNVLSEFDERIKTQGAVVNVPSQLPVMEAIPIQIHQLFLNLFSNAFKFTKTGMVPQVDIGCSAIDPEKVVDYPQLNSSLAYVEVVFADDGIGFDAEQAPRIFEIFQRLHTQEEYPGTGIGLALCKKIVTNHHGDIWVESAEGRGTTFHILLPLQQPQGAAQPRKPAAIKDNTIYKGIIES